MSGAGTDTRTDLLHRWSANLSNLFGPRTANVSSSADSISQIEQIGKTAGSVWQILEREGPTDLGRLVKEVGAPRDLVVLAVGWLAREEKIYIDSQSRRYVISLR